MGQHQNIGVVSEPRAVATGSRSPAGFLRFLLIRSLPLSVLTRSDALIPDYGKRLRYSSEVMNAFTISASTKLPLNWFSLFSQN